MIRCLKRIWNNSIVEVEVPLKFRMANIGTEQRWCHKNERGFMEVSLRNSSIGRLYRNSSYICSKCCQKSPIISKNTLSKSCWALNFVQKNVIGRICPSPPGMELGGSTDCHFQYIKMYKKWQSKFTLGLNAAKNTHYVKNVFK